MYLVALYQKAKWKTNPSQLKLELKSSLWQMIATDILHPLIGVHIIVYKYVRLIMRAFDLQSKR